MEIRRVGVVGLGTMGAGIAQVSVQAGYETVGREISLELAERGKATIDRYLTRGVEKGRLTQEEKDAAIGRLTLTTELADLAGCDLVIEAVVEELPLKREVFAELERVTRPEAVLATNTSALSVAEIAEATERPERVVGMHFFNPAPVLPLVEIVRAPRSSEEAVRAAYEWAEGAGKQPVHCNDTPGFIVNRILIPLLNDCVRVLDEAGVTPEDLDKAMTNGARVAARPLRARRPDRDRRACSRVRGPVRQARRGANGAAEAARGRCRSRAASAARPAAVSSSTSRAASLRKPRPGVCVRASPASRARPGGRSASDGLVFARAARPSLRERAPLSRPPAGIPRVARR